METINVSNPCGLGNDIIQIMLLIYGKRKKSQ